MPAAMHCSASIALQVAAVLQTNGGRVPSLKEVLWWWCMHVTAAERNVELRW